VQLIDVESGNHVWAERYDREEHEIFVLQDNIVRSLVGMGDLSTFTGRPDKAIEWYAQARVIDPHFDPPWWWRNVGVAHFASQRNDEAVDAFSRAPNLPAWAAAYVAASHALAQRPESAQRYAADVLKLLPQFSIATMGAKEPFKHSPDKQRLLDGLRKAGLPD
jgi:adenylate cyclase